jgi:hypothetical protein
VLRSAREQRGNRLRCWRCRACPLLMDGIGRSHVLGACLQADATAAAYGRMLGHT